MGVWQWTTSQYSQSVRLLRLVQALSLSAQDIMVTSLLRNAHYVIAFDLTFFLHTHH